MQDVHLEQITKENDEMHNCAYSVRSKALNGAFGGALSVVGGRAFCFLT